MYGSGELQYKAQQLSFHPVSVELALGESWDTGDPWGSAMAEAFALCDWLTFDQERYEAIPACLAFRPSPMGANTEDYLYRDIVELWPDSGLTIEQVSYYPNLLDEFLDACMAEGLDY